MNTPAKPKAPVIPMQKVKSSNVSEVGHDPATNTLAVKFSSGTTYHYTGVDAKAYEALRGAKSLGSHFATEIRAKFKGVAIPK